MAVQQMIELIEYDRFTEREIKTGITRRGWARAFKEADTIRERWDKKHKSRYGLTLRPTEQRGDSDGE